MFEINAKIVDKSGENGVLKKNINLDVGLDAFVLVSSSNADFADNILNYTIEHLIDKISREDTYHDFSIALENINAFIKTWRSDIDNRLDTLDMVI
jgi:hypothetical protein